MKRLLFILAMVCVWPFASQANAQDGETRWYKGNLHTHSLWSDGDDFPDMIVRWYVEHDYQFLALTDHNVLSEGERWMSAAAITDRGGADVIEKYKRAFGEANVDIRQLETVDGGGAELNETSALEVRLKTYQECQRQFDSPGSFMLMTGEEISDQVNGLPLHLNATNLQQKLQPTGGRTMQEAMRNNLRGAKLQADELGREILVHLNHPNFGWAITAEDLAAVTEEKFFEVYNGHPGVNHLGDDVHPSVEKLWDIASTIRTDKLNDRPLFGLATDDCHYYHGRKGSQPGRGWIMVRSAALTPAAILKAINAGEFYSSSGVEIEDFSFDSKTGKLRIDLKAEEGVQYETQIIGTLQGYDATSTQRTDEEGDALKVTRVYSPDVGKTLATIKGNSVEYQLTGEELYVRATVTSSRAHPNPSFSGQREQAWLQPIMWQPSTVK